MKRSFLPTVILPILVLAFLVQPCALYAQVCKVDTLWLKNGERRIFGKISKPTDGKKKQPIAIIAHGFNGTHHFASDYFEPLAQMGFQVYCFDFPCGSVNSLSDNNTMNMSLLDEVSDMEAIVKHFQKQPDIDAGHIVLIGESQGGLVSALTAARMPEAISQLVLIYPALCIPDNWNERYPNIEDIPDTTHLWNVPMGKRFFTEVRNIKPFDIIPQYKRPVLIVQGDKDFIVAMKDSEKAVELYKDARMHIIPGAGHGFKPDERAIATEQVICFLTQNENKSHPIKTKIIDEGGSGMFKAIAVKESGLPDFVIYRPKDILHAHARCGAMPLLVFANGGCADTNIGYERMLTDIASHGYIVVAIGEMQDKRFDRKEGHTPSTELKRGLDWMVQQSQTKGSDYYMNVDTSKIAGAGHSCGGAQVLANAADPLLKTYLILNAGMGDMTMANASHESLPHIHGPILYIVGGKEDVAYLNAQMDYDRIHHAPVALADHPASGHGGTYGEKFGGDYSRLVIDWLDWQLKEKKELAPIFLNEELEAYPGWSIKSKNFKNRPVKVESHIMPSKLLKGISEREYSIYLPGSYNEQPEKQYPVLYLMHGGGGSHTDWQKYGNLRHLADSLFDCDATEETIIVCPEGNKNHMIYFNAPHWKYEDYFFNEFLPFIEKSYRIDKRQRSIAGFSMGGGAAVVYGVHHPKYFKMVYNISGYLRRQPLDFLKNDPSAEWRQQVVEDNNPIKRIEKGSESDIEAWKKVNWIISVGDQDFTIEANMDLVKVLRSKNIPYIMHVGEGKHDWKYVEPALIDAIKRAGKR